MVPATRVNSCATSAKTTCQSHQEDVPSCPLLSPLHPLFFCLFFFPWILNGSTPKYPNEKVVHPSSDEGGGQDIPPSLAFSDITEGTHSAYALFTPRRADRPSPDLARPRHRSKKSGRTRCQKACAKAVLTCLDHWGRKDGRCSWLMTWT